MKIIKKYFEYRIELEKLKVEAKRLEANIAQSMADKAYQIRLATEINYKKAALYALMFLIFILVALTVEDNPELVKMMMDMVMAISSGKNGPSP